MGRSHPSSNPSSRIWSHHSSFPFPCPGTFPHLLQFLYFPFFFYLFFILLSVFSFLAFSGLWLSPRLFFFIDCNTTRVFMIDLLISIDRCIELNGNLVLMGFHCAKACHWWLACRIATVYFPATRMYRVWEYSYLINASICDYAQLDFLGMLF